MNTSDFSSAYCETGTSSAPSFAQVTFAFDPSKVISVFRTHEVTWTDGSSHLKGVIRLSDRSVPVIDLRPNTRFSAKMNERTLVVVVRDRVPECTGIEVGLIVDAVENAAADSHPQQIPTGDELSGPLMLELAA